MRLGRQDGGKRSRELSRDDFEREFSRARIEKRVPEISGRAAGLDLSNLDFTSDYEASSGSYSGVFIGIDLRHANLSGCVMIRSDFASANLRGANLSRSDLRGANLYNALMESANLNGANLAGANLVSAEFSGTSMIESILEGARFGHTTVLETDLSQVNGLAEVDHYLPSAIDSPTLRLTASGLGSAPDYKRQDFLRFLVAAGVDNELMPVLQSWIGQPVEYYSIFISHSSMDKAFCRRLYRDLQSLGIRCWLDEKQLMPGDSILGGIDRGIKNWDRLLLVCSQNSLCPVSGWWIEQELERALAKERELRRTGKEIGTLIPVTIDDYVFTEWSGHYRSTVIERNIGDFRDLSIESYTESLRKLVSALDRSRCP